MNYKNLLQPRTAKVTQDATFWRRTASFLIDILVLDIVVTAPFTTLFAPIVARADFMNIQYTRQEFVAIILLFFIIFMYFTLFEYLLGQTPGMMLAQTQVTGNTGLFAILLRNSFILPFLPFALFWLIEPLSIIFRGRGVLEQISSTRTVYKREIII